MIVVADSGSIIHLSMVDLVELLPMPFGEVLVPPAVWTEVVEVGAGLPGARELAGAYWARRVEVDAGDDTTRILSADLDPGEVAAIALAIQLRRDRVLVGDLRARLAALRLGIPIVGTLGVLIASKKGGRIGPLAPIVERLRMRGFRIAPDLLARVLAEVGETQL